MLATIETWIQSQLADDDALLELFNEAGAEKVLIRPGEGSEGDSYPAVRYAFLGETDRQINRCGQLISVKLEYEVKAVVKSRSYADSQPYTQRIQAVLAAQNAGGDSLTWNTAISNTTGRRERGTGNTWYVHHGYVIQFEVSEE